MADHFYYFLIDSHYVLLIILKFHGQINTVLMQKFPRHILKCKIKHIYLCKSTRRIDATDDGFIEEQELETTSQTTSW